MDQKDWLIQWFIKNTNISENEILNNLDENYLLSGWIDSLKFINFISNIEDKFSITFSNSEFQDRKFATITGLISIIERKING